MNVKDKKLDNNGNIKSVLVEHNGDRFVLTPFQYLKLCLEGREDRLLSDNEYSHSQNGSYGTSGDLIQGGI